MKAKTLTLAGSVVIIVLIITTTIALILNSKNKRNYITEKTQCVSLVTQNLQRSMDLDKAKSDLASMTSKEEKAATVLGNEESRLAVDAKRLASISKENSLLVKDKNELVQLQKSKTDIDNAYAELEMEHQTTLSRIKDLENYAIVRDAENSELTNKLETSEKDRIDNIEIYGSRGTKKDKPTFVARRVRELNLNFDSPLGKTDGITYKIITPSGEIINPEDKSSAWVVVDHSPQRMTASLSNVLAEPENLRQIELRDISRNKLKSGEYVIQIFSNGKNISNYRLMLR